MSLWWMAFASVFAFVWASFFAGAETAIIAADRIRLRHLSRKGNRQARELLTFIENPENFLSIVLVGTNLGVIGCTTAFTAIMVDLFGNSGVTIATVFLVPFLLVFEEIMPKAVFLYYADKAAVLCVYPLKFFGILFYPIIQLFSGISRLLMKIFRGGPPSPHAQMTMEELLFHLQGSREAGLIPKDTMTLASRAFDFVDLRAVDVMVPIDDVVMVQDGLENDEYRRVFAETRFTRIPVHGSTRSEIVGILSIRNLLRARHPQVDIPALDPVYEVVTTTPIVEILVRMKNQGCHMALVRDEGGRVVGMTTLEDILERLVGAISDEFH
ncbi:MAG: HlyC/CorC family transporter [Candidatus Latescibacterota bacterium]|nr:MAG: HlyC/CorC family transporter [Candidatus Latescibacterota bacterium]